MDSSLRRNQGLKEMGFYKSGKVTKTHAFLLEICKTNPCYGCAKRLGCFAGHYFSAHYYQNFRCPKLWDLGPSTDNNVPTGSPYVFWLGRIFGEIFTGGKRPEENPGRGLFFAGFCFGG